mgnify:CR=1 FL=1
MAEQTTGPVHQRRMNLLLVLEQQTMMNLTMVPAHHAQSMESMAQTPRSSYTGRSKGNSTSNASRRAGREGEAEGAEGKKKRVVVLLRFELRIPDSKSDVITSFTIEP